MKEKSLVIPAARVITTAVAVVSFKLLHVSNVIILKQTIGSIARHGPNCLR